MKNKLTASEVRDFLEAAPCGSERPYEISDGKVISSKSIDLMKEIDWEERRYEIAKSLLPTLYLDDGQAQRANEERGGVGFEYKVDSQLAKEAVRLADALIAELKKGEQQ